MPPPRNSGGPHPRNSLGWKVVGRVIAAVFSSIFSNVFSYSTTFSTILINVYIPIFFIMYLFILCIYIFYVVYIIYICHVMWSSHEMGWHFFLIDHISQYFLISLISLKLFLYETIFIVIFFTIKYCSIKSLYFSQTHTYNKVIYNNVHQSSVFMMHYNNDNDDDNYYIYNTYICIQ